jgi:mRNA-degrading endonuclease RelE of RelBE toxin-antitoxin system
MNYKVIATTRFKKELKRLAKKFPSLKNEFAELIETLNMSLQAVLHKVIIVIKKDWR